MAGAPPGPWSQGRIECPGHEAGHCHDREPPGTPHRSRRHRASACRAGVAARDGHVAPGWPRRCCSSPAPRCASRPRASWSSSPRSALGLAVAIAAVVVALWSARVATTPIQIARLVEERLGGLDDVVVTAVDYAARPGHDPAMAERLAACGGARRVRTRRGCGRRSAALTRSGRTALAARRAARWLAWRVFVRPLGDAASVASAYVLPSRLAIDVEPGDVRVRAGQPLTVRARVRGADGAHARAGRRRGRRCRAGGDDAAGRRHLAGDGRRRDPPFGYHVVAGARASDALCGHRRASAARWNASTSSTPIRRPSVCRPACEEDGGDIYAPRGTEVRFTITADRPVTRQRAGARRRHAACRWRSTGTHRRPARSTIAADGSYRVALVDDDGVETPDDTEYFIRMLLDRPPDVRVLRPAGDRQVTPLEEVLIEARADDDFGVRGSRPGAAEARRPRGRRAAARAARRPHRQRQHTLYLEDLEVSPGDFVTYFVRARDIGRGKPSSEIAQRHLLPRSEGVRRRVRGGAEPGDGGRRSDAGRAGSRRRAEGDRRRHLEARQPRPPRRPRQSATRHAGRSPTAQRALEQRAAKEAGSQLQGADPERRPAAPPRPRHGQRGGRRIRWGWPSRRCGGPPASSTRLQTAAAMPHEIEALNQLLKAEADVQRRQVARQQSGGGGGGNRNTPDLSSLFDQELRKQQQTNYETPASSETRQDERHRGRSAGAAARAGPPPGGAEPRAADLARNRRRTRRRDGEAPARAPDARSGELRQELEELARQMPAARRRAASRATSRRTSSRSAGTAGTARRAAGAAGQQRPARAAGQPPGAIAGAERRPAGAAAADKAATGRRCVTPPRTCDGRRAGCSSRIRRGQRERRPRPRAAASGRTRRCADRPPTTCRRRLGDLQLEARQLADAERRVAEELQRAGDVRGAAAMRVVRRRPNRSGWPDAPIGCSAAAARPERGRPRPAPSARPSGAPRANSRRSASPSGCDRRPAACARAAEPGGTAVDHHRRASPRPPADARRPTRRAGPRRRRDRPRARRGGRAARRRPRRRPRRRAAALGRVVAAPRELRDQLGRRRAIARAPAAPKGSAATVRRPGARRRGPPRPAAGRPCRGPARPRRRAVGERRRGRAICSGSSPTQMREAREQVESLGRDNPDMRGPATPEAVAAERLGAGHRGVQAGLRALGVAEVRICWLALEKVERSLTDATARAGNQATASTPAPPTPCPTTTAGWWRSTTDRSPTPRRPER